MSARRPKDLGWFERDMGPGAKGSARVLALLPGGSRGSTYLPGGARASLRSSGRSFSLLLYQVCSGFVAGRVRRGGLGVRKGASPAFARDKTEARAAGIFRPFDESLSRGFSYFAFGSPSGGDHG